MNAVSFTNSFDACVGHAQKLLKETRILNTTVKVFDIDGQIKISVDQNPVLSKTYASVQAALDGAKQYLLTQF